MFLDNDNMSSRTRPELECVHLLAPRRWPVTGLEPEMDEVKYKKLICIIIAAQVGNQWEENQETVVVSAMYGSETSMTWDYGVRILVHI